MKVLTTPRSYGKTDPEVFAMLRAAGLSVAMGNAVPALVPFARVKTLDCNHDGAALVMEEYMLS